MLLAIDVGNTNLSLGWFCDGSLAGTGRLPTAVATSTDDIERQVASVLATGDLTLTDIDSIACASVVPAVTARLEGLARRRRLPLLLATSRTVPIAILVDRPAEVGADRLVNALAVTRLHGTPAVVADFGTATTVDAVGADGAFLGGAIAPGLALGLEALASRTAQLPHVELRAPDRAIGRSTESAIQAGAVLGYVALARSLIGQVRDELAAMAAVPAASVRVVLTGGLSGLPWAAMIPGVDAIDQDLTLKGLAILHAEIAREPQPVVARR